MRYNVWLRSAVFIGLFLAVSYFIGQMTRENMGWYDTLEKSPFNPPRIVFPIVWTVLYVMLASVASLLWAHRKRAGQMAASVCFAVYMILNWGWSFVFFGAHMVLLGAIWIVVSDAVLLVLMVLLYQRDRKLEAMLLLPTLLWGLFAAYLNGYVYFMN